MAVTNYTWDSINDSCIMEADEELDPTAVYTIEPGMYGRVVSQHRDDQTGFYHYNGLGSTRQLTDDAGDPTDTNLYDAWGMDVASTGATENPYRWVGAYGYQSSPPESTGIYIRRRSYIPSLARWNTMDNLILGVERRLVYSHNDPIRFIDPSGLAEVEVIYAPWSVTPWDWDSHWPVRRRQHPLLGTIGFNSQRDFDRYPRRWPKALLGMTAVDPRAVRPDDGFEVIAEYPVEIQKLYERNCKSTCKRTTDQPARCMASFECRYTPDFKITVYHYVFLYTYDLVENGIRGEIDDGLHQINAGILRHENTHLRDNLDLFNHSFVLTHAENSIPGDTDCDAFHSETKSRFMTKQEDHFRRLDREHDLRREDYHRIARGRSLEYGPNILRLLNSTFALFGGQISKNTVFS